MHFVGPGEENANTAHAAALSIVTYVFIGLALLFTVISIVSIVGNATLRLQLRYQILLNTCISFVFLLIMFLCVNETGNDAGCKTIAFFLTYSLIAYFFWMVIEAHYLYLEFLDWTGVVCACVVSE